MKKNGSCRGVGLGMTHWLRVFGRCHVEGHCLSECLFDCRLVDLCLGMTIMLCACVSSTVIIYGHGGTVS